MMQPNGTNFSSTSSTPINTGGALPLSTEKANILLQAISDRVCGYPITRWIIFILLFCLYIIRVFFIRVGFFVVTYTLAIYLLGILIGFLSPNIDPDNESNLDYADETMNLPSYTNDEYRPFQRKLPEFKCWIKAAQAVTIAIFCTFIKALDLPVVWPILVIYFVSLFILTMRAQIRKMIKHKYIPFDFGKKTYGGITREKKENKHDKFFNDTPGLYALPQSHENLHVIHGGIQVHGFKSNSYNNTPLKYLKPEQKQFE